ncbi:phosphoribosyltransferase [Halosimplex pelagicum]|uniref:Phosphoribosyltransferase n=1 Tax=Halosimplex pelagicum TaxID=869886 RepID=A0A7D5TC32_9EURY|nr:phosphoribosyltransferase family protein [Halosimplex pelagicum]QLH81815.1 phosphoribosyltransferase [Halosimplex pelagicum]
MFRDRTAAGERLADALDERGVTADIVLAIPRGGLPLGRVVADRLDAPLDVVVASKVGAPLNEEYAIGAVAEDGAVWLNEDALDRLAVSDDYLARERKREREVAAEKAATYREGDRPDLTDRRVVVVDDGVATGATMRACLRLVRDEDPESLVVAVPVGPPDTLDDLAPLADEVVAVERPRDFRAVGAHYRNFDQVSDEEAMSYLA